MRNSWKVVAVASVGIVVGALGARVAQARATPHAFLIAEINITDAAGYRQYSEPAAKIVAQFGGQYLARGGATKSIEGAAPANRIAIIEFPDMATLEKFESSAEYGAVRPIRQRAATSRIFAVEGVAK
jgi:uncharacterized protein (DUF1330 family)